MGRGRLRTEEERVWVLVEVDGCVNGCMMVFWNGVSNGFEARDFQLITCLLVFVFVERKYARVLFR